MSEVLSNEEIEQLLGAINSYPNEDKVVNNENASTEKENPDMVKFCIYDFKRPVKFSNKDIQKIKSIFQGFSLLVSKSLSLSMQEMVEVSLASVNPLLYYEFTRSVPNPAFFIIADIEPGLGQIVLEIDPGLSRVIIDRLTGGNGSCKIALKESSDIELELIKQSSLILLECLRESFSKSHTLKPSICRIETNPSNTRIKAENEMCLLFTFTARILDYDGILNICVPYAVIVALLKLLEDNYFYYQSSVNELENLAKEKLNSSVIQRSVLLSSNFLNVKLSDFEKWQSTKLITSSSKDFIFTYESLRNSNGGE